MSTFNIAQTGSIMLNRFRKQWYYLDCVYVSVTKYPLFCVCMCVCVCSIVNVCVESSQSQLSDKTQIVSTVFQRRPFCGLSVTITTTL